MMAKRRVITFTLLTFVLSWGLAARPYFSGMTFVGLLSGSSAGADWSGVAMLALYMWMPALSSILTRLMTRQGFSGMRLGLKLRGTGKYYLLGWLAPFAFAFAGALLYFVCFPGRFDPGLASLRSAIAALAGEDPLRGTGPAAVLAALAMLAFLSAPVSSVVSGPLGEEIGWRGYLFPQLCQFTSPGKAMLISGAIWGVWHAPLIAMGWDYGTGYPGFPWSGTAVLTLCCICFGAFLCHLSLRTDSVWPCALSHSGINLVFSIFLFGNQLCREEIHPLLGAHPFTLAGGWLLILTGGAIMGKALSARHQTR